MAVSGLPPRNQFAVSTRKPYLAVAPSMSLPTSRADKELVGGSQGVTTSSIPRDCGLQVLSQTTMGDIIFLGKASEESGAEQPF